MFYNSLADYEKNHLIAALSFELSHCDDHRVYEGYTKLLHNIDFGLVKTVAEHVNGVVPNLKPLRVNEGKKESALSQTHFAPKKPIIATRRIAVLIADGFNMVEVEAVRAALASAKATTWIIGPRRGKVYSKGRALTSSAGIVADHHFEGQRSTMYDALYIPSGPEHVKTLMTNGHIVHWIREAFGHCKAIGAVGEGVSLF